MPKIPEDDKEEQEQLLPVPDKTYSKVTKWKRTALVMGILTFIFLGIDIFLMVKINSNQPRTNNYTFAVDLINTLKDTNIKTKQFANMIKGLSDSYSDMWFQKSIKIDSWTPQDTEGLTLSRVIDFFTTKIENRLTLIQFEVNTQTLIVGIFTHIPFKIPSNWNDFLVNQTNNYYTFQIDERQSTIVGGNSEVYLKMNGSDSNLTNCKILDLSKDNFVLMEAIDLTYQTQIEPNSSYVTFQDIGQDSSVCFTSNSQAETFYDRLREVTGDVSVKNYKIVSLYSFELSTGMEE